MNATATTREAPYYRGSSLILGSLLDLERDPAGFMQMLTNQYSEIVRLRMFRMNIYLCIHPDAVSHVLHDNHMNYDKQTFDYKMLGDRLLGKGLLTNDGPAWLKQRRLSQPAFHHKRIQKYSEIMQECTAELIENWSQRDGETLDMSEEMANLTLKIVGRTLFSLDMTGQSGEIGDAFSRANHLMTRRIFATSPPFVNFMPLDWKLRSAARRLRAVVGQIIEQRKGKEDQFDDLLSMLMGARDDEGNQMDTEQLKDEVLTLLLAGHETTANALTWSFHLLARNPDEQGRLFDECSAALGKSVADFQTVPKLQRARMVMEESMRIYPPAWSIGRRCIKEDAIMGYRIEPGSLMFLAQLVTHRHPAFWDNPLEFRPERFQEGKKNSHGYAYFPFGGGPRLCIGADFAMMESIIILSALVSRFEFESVKDQVSMELLITLRPAGGMPMRIHKRPN